MQISLTSASHTWPCRGDRMMPISIQIMQRLLSRNCLTMQSSRPQSKPDTSFLQIKMRYCNCRDPCVPSWLLNASLSAQTETEAQDLRDPRHYGRAAAEERFHD